MMALGSVGSASHFLQADSLRSGNR